MFMALVCFILLLVVANALLGAFTKGEIGIRSTTYDRVTQPGAFWLATAIHLGFVVALCFAMVKSYRAGG